MIHVLQGAGAVIEAGELLASLTLASPDKKKKIEPFKGRFTPGGWTEGMPSILSSTEDEDEDVARSILIDYITQVGLISLHRGKNVLGSSTTRNRRGVTDVMLCR